MLEHPSEQALVFDITLRQLLALNEASRDEKISILAEALARHIGCIPPIERHGQLFDTLDYIGDRVDEIREARDWFRQWN